MQIWPQNTETERSSVNHIVDMINIAMFTNETTPSHVMIGHGVVSTVNINMLIISTIWFTLDLLVSVFRGHICYMLGSSSLTWVFRVCNCFAPVVFERRAYHTRSSRGVSARRTFATVHTQGEHFLIISERSSYNATVNQSKIRCIKDKHHMQSI